jgi:hypothetical protein
LCLICVMWSTERVVLSEMNGEKEVMEAGE